MRGSRSWGNVRVEKKQKGGSTILGRRNRDGELWPKVSYRCLFLDFVFPSQSCRCWRSTSKARGWDQRFV
jgi:hypothetical protein